MSKRVLKENYRGDEVEREWKGGENSVVSGEGLPPSLIDCGLLYASSQISRSRLKKS